MSPIELAIWVIVGWVPGVIVFEGVVPLCAIWPISLPFYILRALFKPVPWGKIFKYLSKSIGD